MKAAPAPWIHTGLNIHPRLARFLKKWGFTRESEEESDPAISPYIRFYAIVNGKPFLFQVGKRGFFGAGILWNLEFNYPGTNGDNGIPALNKFMRDNSKTKG